MSSSKSRPLIAVAQLCSTSNVEENFKVVSSLIKEICTTHRNNVSMIFLPENFAFVGDGVTKSYDIADESLSNCPLLTKYASLAKGHKVWLSLGGFPLKSLESQPSQKTEPQKTYNTHIIVNSSGIIVSVYQKLHLFDVDIKNQITIKGLCL
ncbi:hypothetical protein RFI_09664 [Reticulomyxa filosa]|uniref:CN hydrolase domain-containing protein n=1 Tax=Reticulomyxa filosa TaxID=46433 RepID=X6NQ32_RETFI|nr:hypothetical protein RFI_09664 [Reticulomyxa filosa]|eukprot:ETO27467.1 hypothetical protein RFI_09664 [Reticulomyxa filosa]